MLEEPLDDNGQPFPETRDPERPRQLVDCSQILELISSYDSQSIPKDDLAAAVEKLTAN